MRRLCNGLRSLVLAVLALLPVQLRADEVLVAVAANFAPTAATLASAFHTQTGHVVQLASGSTGKLAAQIAHGAPYDLLLAADAESPAHLARDGFARGDTQATYAIGRLALVTATPGGLGPDPIETLRNADYRHLAIANPALAPYGMAARDTLKTLNLWDALQDRIVMGENAGQAAALVTSGAAELGLIAAPGYPTTDGGMFWLVPETYHAPIRQDAVLLVHGADNAAAQAFLRFLASETARALIASDGYGLPSP